MINKNYINKEGNTTYDEYEWIPVDYFPTGGYIHINNIIDYEKTVDIIPTNTFQDLSQYMMG